MQTLVFSEELKLHVGGLVVSEHKSIYNYGHSFNAHQGGKCGAEIYICMPLPIIGLFDPIVDL